MRRGAALLLLLLLPGACLPRVQLPPLPPRDAPLPEREAALERLDCVPIPAPAQSKITGVKYELGPPPFLWLGGGEEVWDPRDLAAVLPAASPTAAAAERFDEHLYRGRIVQLAGVGVVLAGMGLTFAGAVREPTTTSSPGFYLVLSGFSAMGAGLIIGAVGLLYAALATRADTRAAFESWPADLRAALDLE